MSMEESKTAKQCQPKLRVSLNQIDYTVGPPGPLDNTDLPVVPIIRVYGNSSTGQKTCLHIHQVFPYFYIDYTGSFKPKDGKSTQTETFSFTRIHHFVSVKQHIRNLIHSLNHAVALSLKRNPAHPKSRYIRAIILVKGVHFYGFHASYSPFLKVLVADPTYTNRIITLLRSGSVMSTRFRIYESHINFTLQFMCDFGLYGCGLIDLQEVWQRTPDETPDGEELAFERSPHFRQSKMPLEVDAIAPHILNRNVLVSRTVAFKIGDTPPAFPNDPVVPSVRELWEDERARRKAKGLDPSPDMPTDPSDASRGAGGAWVSEARYWEALRRRMEAEATTLDPWVTEHQPWEGKVMTAFESIEALWEPEYQTWKPTHPRPASGEAPLAPGGNNIGIVPGETANQGEEESQVDVDISFFSNEDIEEEGGERTSFLGHAVEPDGETFLTDEEDPEEQDQQQHADQSDGKRTPVATNTS